MASDGQPTHTTACDLADCQVCFEQWRIERNKRVRGTLWQGIRHVFRCLRPPVFHACATCHEPSERPYLARLALTVHTACAYWAMWTRWVPKPIRVVMSFASDYHDKWNGHYPGLTWRIAWRSRYSL